MTPGELQTKRNIFIFKRYLSAWSLFTEFNLILKRKNKKYYFQMNGKCIANVIQSVLFCFCFVELLLHFQPFWLCPKISTTLCTMSYKDIDTYLIGTIFCMKRQIDPTKAALAQLNGFIFWTTIFRLQTAVNTPFLVRWLKKKKKQVNAPTCMTISVSSRSMTRS